MPGSGPVSQGRNPLRGPLRRAGMVGEVQTLPSAVAAAHRAPVERLPIKPRLAARRKLCRPSEGEEEACRTIVRPSRNCGGVPPDSSPLE